MAYVNESGIIALTATAAAIGKNTRVNFNSSGQIVMDGATNNTSIGTAIEDIAASGTGGVKLWSTPGAHFVTVSVAVARGDLLYPAASGKVTNVAGMLVAIGMAFEAATANGDIIQMLPIR